MKITFLLQYRPALGFLYGLPCAAAPLGHLESRRWPRVPEGKTNVKPRPRHPRQDPAAAKAFKRRALHFLSTRCVNESADPPAAHQSSRLVSGRIAIRATGNVDVGVGHRRQSPAATRPISSPRFGRPGGPGPTWIRPFGPWRSCISAASPCDWSEHWRLTRKPNGFRAMRTPPRSSAARTAQATGPLRPGPAESNSPA
jgi:hypothetical protein